MTTVPLKYMPQLDGLRAVAVIVVLCFHLELAGFRGGYLGVSVFFTLSGYLITRLLLDEVASSGRIDYGYYIARRMRRLLPAATIGLIGITIGLAYGWFDTTTNARSGVVAAAAQVYNWFELLAGRSYADLFSAPSPVAHYWSLSIEEQFYWIWPLVIMFAVAQARRRNRSAMPLIARAILVSLGLAVVAALATAIWGSASAVYLATWSRAPEILVGALLAAMAHRGELFSSLRHFQIPLLATVMIAVAVTPTGHGWAYRGGLPAFALVSAALIASLQTAGWGSRLLALRPFVHIGRMSYGLYVYHWPLFLLLTPQRLGFDGIGLVAVRLATTYVIALISMVAVEMPVRHHKFRIAAYWQITTGATLTLLILSITALVIPATSAPAAAPQVISAVARPADASSDEEVDRPADTAADDAADDVSSSSPTSDTTADTGRDESDDDASGDDVVADTGEPVVRPTDDGVDPSPDGGESAGGSTNNGLPATTSVPSPPTTDPPATVVAFFGDSVGAWMLRDAASSFDRTDVVILNGTIEGCDGYAVATETRSGSGQLLPLLDNCTPWTTTFPGLLSAAPAPPDVAVLMVGQTASLDHNVDGQWQGPCDDLSWYIDDLSNRIDWLERRGVAVTLALPAHPGRKAVFIEPNDYWLRFDCVRQAMSDLAVVKRVDVIDLDEMFCYGGSCENTRSDGVHLDPEYAPIALDFILDRVIDQSSDGATDEVTDDEASDDVAIEIPRVGPSPPG